MKIIGMLIMFAVVFSSFTFALFGEDNSMIINTYIPGLTCSSLGSCGLNLTGSTGPQGPQGIHGINGTNGINGVNGSNGAAGSNGANGLNGTNAYNITINNYNTSAQMFNAVNNGTFLIAINLTNANTSMKNYVDAKKFGNTSSEIFSVVNNNTFVKYSNLTNYPTKTDMDKNITSANTSMKNYADNKFYPLSNPSSYSPYIPPNAYETDLLWMHNGYAFGTDDIRIIFQNTTAFNCTGSLDCSLLLDSISCGTVSGCTWSGGSETTEVLHYKMNDNAANTDVADSSTYSNTGTATTTTDAMTATGQINSALNMQSSYHINVPALPYQETINGDTPHSISLWFNDYSSSAGGNMWGYGGWRDTGGEYMEQIQSSGWACGAGYAQFSVGQQDAWWVYICSNTQYLDNNWHHLVAVWHGDGNAEMYIDNSLVGSSSSMSIPSGSVATRTGEVGSYEGGNIYEGAVDDFRLYNGALDSSAVSTLWASGSGTETDYNFGGSSGCSGTPVQDCSQFISYGTCTDYSSYYSQCTPSSTTVANNSILFNHMNVIAGDYITQTSVYDSSKYGSALSRINNPQELLNEDGTINHKAFGYSYAEIKSDEKITTIQIQQKCSINFLGFKSLCKDTPIQVIENAPPIEGVSLGNETALLREAIWELKVKVQQLESENEKDNKCLDESKTYDDFKICRLQ